MPTKYPIGETLHQVSALLEISPERVLRRVGLSGALAVEEDISVGAETFFKIWDAVREEAAQPGLELK